MLLQIEETFFIGGRSGAECKQHVLLDIVLLQPIKKWNKLN